MADREPPVSGISPWTCLRSEEHTSELQSRSDLVCRLLLEKKNKKKEKRKKKEEEKEEEKGRGSRRGDGKEVRGGNSYGRKLQT